MIWSVCFIISLCTILLAVILSIVLNQKTYNRKRIFKPFHVLFGGVSVSAVLILFPVYLQMFQSERYQIWKSILLSLHNTLRLFVLDEDFTIIIENIGILQKDFAEAYSLLAAIIFVIAPFLTFGVVLSFFKNMSAYKDYVFCYFLDGYIFSELNEKSLALAKSLKQNNKKRAIIFTDVFSNNEEMSYELKEAAHEIGAITFKKDITVVDFGLHSKRRNLTFFVMSEDDDENIKQALALISKYNDRLRTSLYVFSTSVNSELLLNAAPTGVLKVRRVNTVQSLISRNLYDKGVEIFENAVECGKDEKVISAVIVGMGQYGTEMAKALPWFCQMDGYHFEMNVFDINENAESRFCALCPELMDSLHNGDFTTKGEAHYKITFHSKVDVETKEFYEHVEKLQNVTYVFISMGSDEKNIRLAAKLRSVFEKRGIKPQINAVVYNSDKMKALSGITNYSKQAYDIRFIGDISTSYSEKVILRSEIEEIALQRHLKWGEEEQFWKYEYNYRSSIASAIHRKMKILCKMSGIEKPIEQRTEEEIWALRELEHRRWNAYIRSEGYTYAEERNNLAKTHHCLIPFYDLPLKEQKKDDD